MSHQVIDFGYSGLLSAGTPPSLTGLSGTPDYVAPEVLGWYPTPHPTDEDLAGECICAREYGAPADMWSVGVVVFVLLGGAPPFFAVDEEDLVRSVRAGEYTFDASPWECVSTEAKQFIRCCLALDPLERPTATEALKHPWLLQGDSHPYFPYATTPFVLYLTLKYAPLFFSTHSSHMPRPICPISHLEICPFVSSPSR